MTRIFSPTRHLTEETLEEYALNREIGCDLQVIEEHLVVCKDCQDHLTEVEQEILFMRDMLKLAQTG